MRFEKGSNRNRRGRWIIQRENWDGDRELCDEGDREKEKSEGRIR
jgi:hypothetical protein